MTRPPAQRWSLAALLLLATFAVYSPVLAPDTGFLWDDDDELWGVRGDLVQDADGIRQAWLPLQRPQAGARGVLDWEPVPGHGFWPLTPTVFWLEWRLFGADERWASSGDRAGQIEAVERIANRFHAPNILLHALNAMLVWLVLARLGVPCGAWIGLFFALHPVNVPSVAWVSELKNTLSLFFLLLSFDAFLRYDERPGRAVYAGSLGLFFLSLTAKTAGVGLPFVLLGALWWRHGALDRRALLRVAPFFGLAFAMGLTTLWFTRESGGLTGLVQGPQGFWQALSGAGWVALFYAWKTFLPVDLMMIYPRLDAASHGLASYLPILGIAGLVGAAWTRRAQWGRGPFFALTAAGALLFPVLGFFPMTFAMHSEVSDHLQYLGIIPMLALAIAGIGHFTATRPDLRRRARGVGIAMLLILGMLSHERAKLFKDHISLWTDNVERNPAAWMAHYDLGAVLLQESDRIETADARLGVQAWALEHLERAAQLQPAYSNAHYQYGRALSRTGDDARAVEAWRTALELDLRSRPVGNEEEATRRLEIGRAEKRLQRFAAARDELERSLELWPGRPLAHFQLGLTLLRLGDEAGAMAQLERVLAIEPNHFKALVRLSTLYSSALDPSLRDGQAAMDIALEAQRAAPPDLGSRLKALHALAAAHAERGWANPAIREAEMQEARALTNDAMQQALKANDMQAFRLAARLSRHYSSGRPLRRAAPR